MLLGVRARLPQGHTLVSSHSPLFVVVVSCAAGDAGAFLVELARSEVPALHVYLLSTCVEL